MAAPFLSSSALRKKYSHVLQIAESLAMGNTLNKEQEEVLRSKPQFSAFIDECERLRLMIPELPELPENPEIPGIGRRLLRYDSQALKRRDFWKARVKEQILFSLILLEENCRNSNLEVAQDIKDFERLELVPEVDLPSPGNKTDVSMDSILSNGKRIRGNKTHFSLDAILINDDTNFGNEIEELLLGEELKLLSDEDISIELNLKDDDALS